MSVFWNILAGSIGILFISNGIDWLRDHCGSTEKKAWGFISIVCGAVIIVIAISI